MGKKGKKIKKGEEGRKIKSTEKNNRDKKVFEVNDDDFLEQIIKQNKEILDWKKRCSVAIEMLIEDKFFEGNGFVSIGEAIRISAMNTRTSHIIDDNFRFIIFFICQKIREVRIKILLEKKFDYEDSSQQPFLKILNSFNDETISKQSLEDLLVFVRKVNKREDIENIKPLTIESINFCVFCCMIIMSAEEFFVYWRKKIGELLNGLSFSSFFDEENQEEKENFFEKINELRDFFSKEIYEFIISLIRGDLNNISSKYNTQDFSFLELKNGKVKITEKRIFFLFNYPPSIWIDHLFTKDKIEDLVCFGINRGTDWSIESYPEGLNVNSPFLLDLSIPTIFATITEYSVNNSKIESFYIDVNQEVSNIDSDKKLFLHYFIKKGLIWMKSNYSGGNVIWINDLEDIFFYEIFYSEKEGAIELRNFLFFFEDRKSKDLFENCWPLELYTSFFRKRKQIIYRKFFKYLELFRNLSMEEKRTTKYAYKLFETQFKSYFQIQILLAIFSDKRFEDEEEKSLEDNEIQSERLNRKLEEVLNNKGVKLSERNERRGEINGFLVQYFEIAKEVLINEHARRIIEDEKLEVNVDIYSIWNSVFHFLQIYDDYLSYPCRFQIENFI